MLTLKQEKFIQGLLDGLSQRESYKQAYNCENMSDKTIDEKASRLFNTDKIRARYDRLLDAYASQRLIERSNLTTRMIDLLDRATEDTINKGFKQGNIAAMTLAVKTLQELNGLNFNDDLNQSKLQLEVEKLEITKEKNTSHQDSDSGSLLRQWFGREKKNGQ